MNSFKSSFEAMAIIIKDLKTNTNKPLSSRIETALFNAPANATPTAYKFATEPATQLPKLQQVITKLQGIYGFTNTELEDFKSKLGDKVKVIKIDVDKNPKAAAAYQVRGVPTLVLFKAGQIKWRQSGVVMAQDLIKIVNQHA